MGSYGTVDKTKQRQRIRNFLEGKVFADIGVRQKKKRLDPNPNEKNLQFDEKGNWIGRR